MTTLVSSMEAGVLRALLLLGVWSLMPVQGFRWDLFQVVRSGDTLTLSEGYMFASRQGPWLSDVIADNSDSSINLAGIFTTYSAVNQSGTVSYVVYGKDLGEELDALNGGSWNLQGQCEQLSSEGLAKGNTWAIGLTSHTYRTEYAGTIDSSDPLLSFLNTTFSDDNTYGYAYQAGDNLLDDSTGRRLEGQLYYKYRVAIADTYVVEQVAWYGGALKACGAGVLFSSLSGEVAFKNPYGYIPAEFFGVLPFEMVRLFALIALALFFSLSCAVFAANLLPLHYGILAACVVAMVDGAVSLAAYATINASGQPDCCPYASPIIATLTVQIIRQTASRVLLLVVALGYGIARPSLSRNEWIGLLVLAIAYLVCNLVAEFGEVKFEKSNPYGPPASSAYLGVEILLSLFTDALFLTWIFQALNSTMRVLNEFKQTYKLELYQKITNIVIAFTAVFILFLVLLSFDLNGLLGFPWQMSWVQLVIWEVLNFAILAAICIVCRPNRNSLLLSYASQLPTSDEEDLDDDQRFDQMNDFDNDDLILPQVEKPASQEMLSGRTFNTSSFNPIRMNLNLAQTRGKTRSNNLSETELSFADDLDYDTLPSAPAKGSNE